MADVAEESSIDVNIEVAAEWERDFGLFDKKKVQFPLIGRVPQTVAGSYEAYLPGIDGPGMFDPPAKHEERNWKDNLASGVGMTYIGASAYGIALGGYQAAKISKGAPMRMKLNAFLNYCGKNGRVYGNRFAGMVMIGCLAETYTTYLRRRRDYYNVVVPATLAGGYLGFRGGIYTALAGAVAGLGAGVVGAGLWQRKDGQPVLPELQRLVGVSLFGGGASDGGADDASGFALSTTDIGEELHVEEPVKEE